jgi:hypothetical protein
LKDGHRKADKENIVASWNGLVDYVRQNYKITDETPGGIKLVFDFGDGRSQMVFLWRQQVVSEEWVQVESPCAEVGQVSLQRMLEELGTMVCGGAAIIGSHVVVRNSMPLADMDVTEFERPLQLVTSTADELESKLFGGDRY